MLSSPFATWITGLTIVAGTQVVSATITNELVTAWVGILTTATLGLVSVWRLLAEARRETRRLDEVASKDSLGAKIADLEAARDKAAAAIAGMTALLKGAQDDRARAQAAYADLLARYAERVERVGKPAPSEPDHAK